MTYSLDTPCTAFAGTSRLASGTLLEVAAATKQAADVGEVEPVLIFDDLTSRSIELDLRGSIDDVLHRIAPEPTTEKATVEAPPEVRPRGRPRLGVVAREVTLLPRHWEWLGSQPGGASVALRKLVEDARSRNAGRDRIRLAQESAYRFMSAMAGNERGFEEAIRALFAGNGERFDAETASWPPDVRAHARKLAAVALTPAD